MNKMTTEEGQTVHTVEVLQLLYVTGETAVGPLNLKPCAGIFQLFR
jgi:hypothetical protein